MCVSESIWKVLSKGIGFISLRLMKRKWQECKDNYANWQITTTTFFARKLQIAIDLIFSKVPSQIFLPIFNRNTPCNYWPQGTGSRRRQACILITRWHQRCDQLSEGTYQYLFIREGNHRTSYYVTMCNMSLMNLGPLKAARFSATLDLTKDLRVDFSLMIQPIEPKF